jgi:hypothetical protein
MGKTIKGLEVVIVVHSKMSKSKKPFWRYSAPGAERGLRWAKHSASVLVRRWYSRSRLFGFWACRLTKITTYFDRFSLSSISTSVVGCFYSAILTGWSSKDFYQGRQNDPGAYQTRGELLQRSDEIPTRTQETESETRLDKWNSNNRSLFTKTWKNVITSPTAAREQSGFVLRDHALENP